MTDSDPIIAEIDASNATHYTGFVPVHLSDAPLVEDLLKAAKEATTDSLRAWFVFNRVDDMEPNADRFLELVRDDPNGPEPSHAEEEILRRIAAIRAIEPGWTP